MYTNVRKYGENLDSYCSTVCNTSAAVRRRVNLRTLMRWYSTPLFCWKNSPQFAICVCYRMGLKELFLKPHVFLRRPEFAMIWGVYASTYITANLVITTCERRNTDAQWPKFIGTTSVNMTACISKVCLRWQRSCSA